MKDGYMGKAYKLTELGITKINLPTTNETQKQDNFDGQGNDLMTQEGATFIIDGIEVEYADIWHSKK